MTKNFEKDCAHCPGGLGLEYPLYDDNLFWVVCDVHPLIQGHILIIPKEHISTMGNLSEDAFKKYVDLYSKVKSFISAFYGEVGIFEHGITGQTVFHAHTHFLPFSHDTKEIISDQNVLHRITALKEVKHEFAQKQKYLFFENKNQMWLVDIKLGFPRFFRDIFAELLDAKERANWEKTRENQKLMKQFKKDISALTENWNKHNK
ncbi:HIT family protein [Patescibacteria group bacterium AH-259-L07]|nr:HIT family protein [Patescibacteria group bacterium AH-259-L07]